MSSLGAILVACLITSVTAIPQPANPQPNCNNPGMSNGILPECWEILGMTDYTKAWWAANSTKCNAGTGFSTCFMQVYSLGASDCTGIKPSTCTSPDPTRYTPQEWYVLYNIFAVNQVFYSLYSAISNANTLASERAGAIVSLLNPPVTSNVLAHDLLGALSAGLALLPGPSGVIAGTLVKVAQQVPGVGSLLFPVGTTDSRLAQWANINNEVATVVQTYQSSVSDIIPTINNNIDNFLKFAGTGNFSVHPLPDLSDESDALLQGLTTFIIGKALDASNIHINRAVNLNVQQLQQSSGDGLAFDTGCATGYDAEGICGPYWYDPTTTTTYTLNNYKTMTKSYHDQMETMFGNWTSGNLLLGGNVRQLDEWKSPLGRRRSMSSFWWTREW